MNDTASRFAAGGHRETRLPPAVLLIAEHLDAMLAAGEDLILMDFDLTGLSHPGVRLAGGGEADGEHAPPVLLSGFIARVRVFEAVVLMRLERARACAGRLLIEDERFVAPIRMFLAGTTGLTDALAAVAGECRGRGEGVSCPLAFMRLRGLVGEECGSFTGLLRLSLGEDYRVAGAIPLGVVMDHAATFLDVLDRHYDLFPEPSIVFPVETDDDARAAVEPDVTELADLGEADCAASVEAACVDGAVAALAGGALAAPPQQPAI